MSDPAGDANDPGSRPGAATVPASYAQMHPPTAPPPGYEIVEVIGQGGMGVVYRARDLALDRPVALKYLREGFADHPSVARRFQQEARVTARLQHPGIPPVHQVGALPDGRPFLDMKLIEGRTLSELLEKQGPGAARWLGVFESICQAVGYAHSQGVIHRDLKPSNVMVGAFGEVQVMDWGLAKSLTDAAPAGRAAPATDPDGERLLAVMQAVLTEPPSGPSEAPPVERTKPAAETRPGSVMGTPAYMPPEQAVGAVDLVDRRSDVFGLGAILCELLTGRPPFLAADNESARRLAAGAQLDDAFALLDGCGAEAELVALARRCLAARPDDRPRDAGELAAAVARLRQQAEDRARQAELERAGALVEAREQRKRRRLTLLASGALAAVLLAGVVSTSAGLYGAVLSRDEANRERGKAEVARDDAVEARDEAETARGKEEKARARAEKANERARHLYREALDAFNEMVFGVQTRLATRTGTQELRKDLLERAREGLRRLLREARQQGRNPDVTLLYVHLRLGDVERVTGNTQNALKEYQAGHELARRLAEQDENDEVAQRDLGISYGKLADVMLQLGQTEKAETYCHEALRIRLKLAQSGQEHVANQRGVSSGYSTLGDVMQQQGKAKGSEEHYRKALAITEKLVEAEATPVLRRDLGLIYDRLGDALLLQRQNEAALDFFRRALEVSRQLAGADEKNAEAQRDLHVSISKMAEMSARFGQTEEAEDAYGEALKIARKLADEDEKSAQARRDLSVIHTRLGDLLLRLNRIGEAEGHFQQALQIRQKLSKDDDSAQAARDLLVILTKKGAVALRLGKAGQAADCYRDALEIGRRLAEDPMDVQVQNDLVLVYRKLGEAEKMRYDYARARGWFEETRKLALALRERKLLTESLHSWLPRLDQEILMCRYADRALRDLDFVFALKPEQIPPMLYARVRALLYQKKNAEAVGTAGRWAEWAEKQDKQRDAHRYAAARAYALCAAEAKEKGELTGLCVGLLTKAREGGYFREAKIVARFEQEADFAAIRKEPAFVKFAATLKK
jgi:serine/threonine protein kinase